MICIAIFQPDGTGGYNSEPWGAWTSSDVDVVQSSITFKANTLTSVDRLGNTFDASRAQGGVPSPITGSFSVADMLAIGRISSDLFSGAAPFMGWRVRIWLGRRRDGSDLSEPWNQGEFACSGADHDSDTITISVIQTYALNARTIGTGVAGQVVGLVVGQHEVVVPTPELPDPVVVERTDVAGDGTWLLGIPGNQRDASTTATKATSKFNVGSFYYFSFRCFSYSEASRLSTLILDNVSGYAISGKDFVSQILDVDIEVYGAYHHLDIRVEKDFYDSEDAADVAIYLRDSTFPVVAGASAVVGWGSVDRPLMPIADVAIDPQTFVLSVSPRILTPDGFASMTLVDFSLSWTNPVNPPGVSHAYYGDVAAVKKNTDATPVYDSYDPVTLVPTGSSTVTIWARFGSLIQTRLPLRLSISDQDAKDFDAFVVDAAARVIWQNDSPTLNATVTARLPWSLRGIAGVTIGPGDGLSETFPLVGQTANIQAQRFATIDDANAAIPNPYAGMHLSALTVSDLAANYQLSTINLYGISYLSSGSTKAIVKPGPSIYPDSSVSTITAAQYILQEAGGNVYNVNDPFGNFGPVNQAWIGAYIEPDKTLAEAAHDLANDLWYVLPPASNRTQLAAMPEVFEAPEVPLGRLEDVVTEPVIEYGNGLRAYIQNIDQEFDPARPDDFYGGWGFLRDDLTGTPLINYGFSAWSTCRDAYLRHGIKASETFKAPSIQEADALGYIWTQTNRNGVSRLEWLANPPRFATFRVATDSPGSGFAWAGTRVTIPQKMAEYAGYDWSAWGVATEGATITEASIDPISLEITYTVILPPTLEIPGASDWINDSEAGDYINDAETGDYINDVTR